MRFKGLFKFLDSFSGQLLTLIIGGIVLFQVASLQRAVDVCSAGRANACGTLGLVLDASEFDAGRAA